MSSQAAKRWGRWALAWLALTVLLALPSSGQESDLGLLAGYSFDEADLAAGPDTFRIFEDSKGKVDLSSAFRLSGYHSVVLRDVAGDRAFPELQGYFELRREGTLYAHFALLLTDPREELNVALAGPEWFRLGKDGIGFWLSTAGGFLVHYSDSIPKRLFEPRPFVWYHVDLVFDVGAGRYDLRIQEEGDEEPIVDLRDQPNAASQPGSAVDKFSFIGDRGQDTSNVVYYIDDVLIASNTRARLRPLAAPGRRRLFIDSLSQLRATGSRRGCLTAVELGDFGVEGKTLEGLRRAGLPDAWRALTGAEAGLTSATAGVPGLAGLLAAADRWRQGCAALERREPREALTHFEAALEAAPEAPLYVTSYVLALAQEGEWELADEWMSWLSGRWREDPRLPVLAARVRAERGELEAAEDWLVTAAGELFAEELSPLIARLWSGEGRVALAGELKAAFPDDWHLHLRRALITEELYHALAWQERFADARDYALAVAALVAEAGIPNLSWLERGADAAFYAGQPEEARTLYESCLEMAGEEPRLLLKLADVYFALGNVEKERILRERIYGRLEAESR